jgi:SAM-dependent methyltransferase/cephalosporin hydroxylase
VIGAELVRARGYFGTVSPEGIDGWILSTPEVPVDSFELRIDGIRQAVGEGRPLPDAPPATFPPGVVMAFTFPGPFALRRFARVEVFALRGGQAVSRMATPWRDDLQAVPNPPEHLLVRVTGNPNASVVKAAGLRCAGEFLDSLARHRPLDSLGRVLDWGCGCARVTVHLIDALRTRPWIHVDGADLDGEAIAWAQEHVEGGTFTAIQPLPPLPWPDGTFDAVVACSVFTHLTEEVQQLWLAEMMRVISPGGLLLASITQRGAAEGFADLGGDAMLDGIAPGGYYRGVAQTRAYTLDRWSQWFDVAEFVDAGLESVQDLVVMRRRGAGGGTQKVVSVQAPTAAAPRGWVQRGRRMARRLAQEWEQVRASRPAQAVAGPAPAPRESFPPGHFYSAIPNVEEVSRDERIFRTDDSLPGIDLRPDQQLALFHRLARFYDELPYARQSGERLRYQIENNMYGPGDAVILYSMIRHLQPQRIVEVGSGYSSCVMLDTNELFFGGRIDCTFIDPNAEVVRTLLTGSDGRQRIVAKRVQDMPESTFTQLAADDILFIDSTHVLKAGSDVNFLLFEILPLLQGGVYVHIHDIFYPFQYPRSWIVDLGLSWNEAYAVRAFLQYNGAFEIAFFNTYLDQVHPGLIAAAMPLYAKNPGASLWLRKV